MVECIPRIRTPIAISLLRISKFMTLRVVANHAQMVTNLSLAEHTCGPPFGSSGICGTYKIHLLHYLCLPDENEIKLNFRHNSKWNFAATIKQGKWGINLSVAQLTSGWMWMWMWMWCVCLCFPMWVHWMGNCWNFLSVRITCAYLGNILDTYSKS